MNGPLSPPSPLSLSSSSIIKPEHASATKYYNLATLIILLYDHMLTFDVEVEKIWRQKSSLPKALWFVFRYLTPVVQVGSILADHLTNWTHDSCFQWLWCRFVAHELITAAFSIILILRIWVLFERAYWPLAIMLGALLAQTVTTLWSFFAFTAATLPGLIGCLPAPESPDKVGQVGSLFISLLVLDIVIFFLSVLRIVRQIPRPDRTLSVSAMILRDGIIYFFIICLVNLVNVLLIELPGIPNDLKPLNTEFTPTITVIMVSRLFLNLRSSARQPTPIVAPRNAPWATVSSMIGNVGEPVQYNTRIEIEVSTEYTIYKDGQDEEEAIALQQRRRRRSRKSLL